MDQTLTIKNLHQKTTTKVVRTRINIFDLITDISSWVIANLVTVVRAQSVIAHFINKKICFCTILAKCKYYYTIKLFLL